MFVLMMTAAWSAAPQPGDASGFDEVFRALSHRHAQPCEEIMALTATPVDTLRQVVDQITQPPWAPMRAAECLQRHHAEAVRADLLRWVSEPGLKGLGRQTVGLVDVLPTAVAVEVGRAALVGPVADRARVELARDGRREVQVLVEALAVPAEVTP